MAKLQKHLFIVKNKDSLMCYFLSAIVFILLICILTNPIKYNASVLEGITLFFVAVFPGLFPFMFLTKLLTSLGAVKKISTRFSPITKFLFNTHGISSYVFLMSIISGYPIGAKLISDLYCNKIITQEDAKKMCSFCTTSGPIFIIGSVGITMFGSAKVGIIIYISHIVSSILCGIVCSGKRRSQNQSITLTQSALPDNILASTMTNTIESILLVGAYITIFFLFADILTDIGLLHGISMALNKILSIFGIEGLSDGIVGGLLEVTRGCKILSRSHNIYAVCFACSCISFSGFSIIMQSMSFLKKCKIKTLYLILVKCLHCVISFICCLIACKLFNPF